MKVFEIFELLYSHNRKFSFDNLLNWESYKSCEDMYVTTTTQYIIKLMKILCSNRKDLIFNIYYKNWFRKIQFIIVSILHHSLSNRHFWKIFIYRINFHLPCRPPRKSRNQFSPWQNHPPNITQRQRCVGRDTMSPWPDDPMIWYALPVAAAVVH